jgi:hypothetical protein
MYIGNLHVAPLELFILLSNESINISPLMGLLKMNDAILIYIIFPDPNWHFSPGQTARKTESFDAGWKFFLGDDTKAKDINYNDNQWRKLDLPHDWSIEGKFDEHNSTTQSEGGLPAGIGWYRKTFTVPAASKESAFLLILMAFTATVKFG